MRISAVGELEAKDFPQSASGNTLPQYSLETIVSWRSKEESLCSKFPDSITFRPLIWRPLAKFHGWSGLRVHLEGIPPFPARGKPALSTSGKVQMVRNVSEPRDNHYAHVIMCFVCKWTVAIYLCSGLFGYSHDCTWDWFNPTSFKLGSLHGNMI